GSTGSKAGAAGPVWCARSTRTAYGTCFEAGIAQTLDEGRRSVKVVAPPSAGALLSWRPSALPRRLPRGRHALSAVPLRELRRLPLLHPVRGGSPATVRQLRRRARRRRSLLQSMRRRRGGAAPRPAALRLARGLHPAAP